MIQILAAGLTATFAGLGWLIARWLQRDALMERVDRRLKLVALHQRMSCAGLTMRDLDLIERELEGEKPAIPEQNVQKSRRIHVAAIVQSEHPVVTD